LADKVRSLLLQDAYVMMIDRILAGYRPADYAEPIET
jgi:hypothetical protein